MCIVRIDQTYVQVGSKGPVNKCNQYMSKEGTNQMHDITRLPLGVGFHDCEFLDERCSLFCTATVQQNWVWLLGLIRVELAFRKGVASVLFRIHLADHHHRHHGCWQFEAESDRRKPNRTGPIACCIPHSQSVLRSKRSAPVYVISGMLAMSDEGSCGGKRSIVMI